MRELTPRVAQTLSVLLSLALLAIIGVSLQYMLEYGSGFLSHLRPMRQGNASGMFVVAVLLYLIGGTDGPAAIRRSKALRVQLQCWVIWFILVVGLFYGQSEGFPSSATTIFGLLASALGAYSFVALFRPRDLL
jgi:hypothetical protein